MSRYWLLAIPLLLVVPSAHAHFGSKDVFEQVAAGPYKLFITVRPPNVIPGIATVEVRATGPEVAGLQITPTPLTGEASKHPPTADAMQRSSADPKFFTGGVWMMGSGSWEIRFVVDGASGRQTVAVPVPAVALSTLTMQRSLGIPLALLGVFLVVTMAGLVAAALREASLEPGKQATPMMRRRGALAMLASLIVMGAIVYGGAKWWHVEAASYAGQVYRPLKAEASLNGGMLDLNLHSFLEAAPPYQRSAPVEDKFLPDHGHMMHLYAVREPEMDAVFHLHPEMLSSGHFRIALPVMPPGEYKLFGDIVHGNGFPETLVTTLKIPAGVPPSSPGSDDAAALPAPISAGPLGAAYKLPDGDTMVWSAPATLRASTAYSLRFTLLGPDGKPAGDMQPYMGMAGHAAFIKHDGTVFAHTHPDGSAAMAAVELANQTVGDGGMASMTPATVEPTVEFPYGFPTPGPYRIVIQMKHGDTIETGVFDASVQQAPLP